MKSTAGKIKPDALAASKLEPVIARKYIPEIDGVNTKVDCGGLLLSSSLASTPCPDESNKNSCVSKKFRVALAVVVAENAWPADRTISKRSASDAPSVP